MEKSLFCLKIELHSEILKSVVTKCEKFLIVPRSFEEVMTRVEESHAIPTFCQKVQFKGINIQQPQTAKLSSFNVNSGDTILIQYPISCELQKVKKLQIGLHKV